MTSRNFYNLLNLHAFVTLEFLARTGMMEWWNIGMLGKKAVENHFWVVLIPLNPMFHYSNCERSKLSSISGAEFLSRGTILCLIPPLHPRFSRYPPAGERLGRKAVRLRIEDLGVRPPRVRLAHLSESDGGQVAKPGGEV